VVVFRGKELHSIRCWGQTGDNFSERGDKPGIISEKAVVEIRKKDGEFIDYLPKPREL